MADSQKLQSTAAVGSNLPYAIIHRLPNFQFSLSCVEDIVNLIEPSDPLFPIHGPSARVVIDIGPSPIKLEHFDQYPSVEYILGTSAGVDHIDLDECHRRNIRVTSAGDAFSEDGADYAIGLLLNVLRRVSASDRYVRAGLWPVKGDYPLGNKLGGKRVGIVGIGNIGTLVAKRLEPFGCTIGYTSRTKKPQVPYQFYSTVLDLATHSDALIICCSLTEKTRHVINHDVLTALGKKGIIVNVGRGALVDEKELVKLLVGGELGGAGLDVFENEPYVPMELVTMDNVVLSPHKAILTPESFEALRGLIRENVIAFYSKKPLTWKHLVALSAISQEPKSRNTALNLATNSDALIVRCSLTVNTRQVINHDVCGPSGFRKRGIIVNIGFGSLVDKKELVKLLVGGELQVAGLDLFENEPDVPKDYNRQPCFVFT